jgi:NAD(P)-dependent dehydrogenase (short-subunit alcohol dehydrogenase family)
MAGILEGKVALVTGAARGIGLATAKAFAEVGAAVVLADRDGEIANRAADELRQAGHHILAVTCDVAVPAQVVEMVSQAVATFGRLDAAFNNAGVNSDGAPMLDTSDEEFERILSINLRGVWNCMKAMSNRRLRPPSMTPAERPLALPPVTARKGARYDTQKPPQRPGREAWRRLWHSHERNPFLAGQP